LHQKGYCEIAFLYLRPGGYADRKLVKLLFERAVIHYATFACRWRMNNCTAHAELLAGKMATAAPHTNGVK
jgi:hypothetical protein